MYSIPTRPGGCRRAVRRRYAGSVSPAHEDEDPPARADFHLALAGVVLPFASFALSALLAGKNAAHRGGPAQASWTKRLAWLSAFDFLVLLSSIALVLDKAPPSAPLEGPDSPAHPLLEGLARLGAAWGAAVGILAVIALIAARRVRGLDPSPLAVWIAFAGTLAAADVALVGATLAVAGVVGGSSLGGGLLGVCAGSGVLLAAAAAWRARLLRRGALEIEAPRAPAWRSVLVGMGYILAGLARVGLVLAAATRILHLPATDPGAEIREIVHPGAGPAGVVGLVIAAVVLAPVGEETLFRGVLLPWLRRFLSPDAAAWASAGIFAAGHLRYGPSVLVVVVYGLALAWARLHTGRLRASIAMHMIINATALAVTLVHR
jgi:membrane protease YdiL (CAAX protease family)